MKSTVRLQLIFLCILFTSVSLFVAGWAFICLISGSYLAALVSLGAAIWSFDIAFQMAYVTSEHVRPRLAYGTTGTVLRPQKFVDHIFSVSSVAGVSAAALYLTLSPLGMLDAISSNIVQHSAFAISGFVVVFGGWNLYGMLRRGGESYLRLDPRGVEVWNGHWGSSARRAWEEIEEVSDRPPHGKKVRREMVVFTLSDRRYTSLIFDTITADSHALREWVRFYWQHPERRDELTDERASRRLEEEKFTVE